MRQNSSDKSRIVISMEEYLKKRQAIKPSAATLTAEEGERAAAALKLAELLLI